MNKNITIQESRHETPSHPQSNLAQQGKGISEVAAPKGNPNQILLPNFHAYRKKYSKIHIKKKNYIYWSRMLRIPQVTHQRED